MFEYINIKLAKTKGSKKLRKLIRKLKNFFGEKDPGALDFKFSTKPSRLFIVQSFINKKKFNSYLEIGTFDNELFDHIKCKNKVGVDPFSGGTHRMTSDEFFLQNRDKFDCIFIDGLHHYDQVKRDINNSLKFINDQGIVLVHDCLPENIEAQSVPRTITNWNGDVWKAFAEIRANPNLNSYTCLADHGIGVILKSSNKKPFNFKIKNFKKLKFLDYYKNHYEMMNIIEYEDLIKII